MATHGKSEIEAYLGSAAKLINRLESGKTIDASVMTELDATLKVKCPRSPAAKAAEFDRFGTRIWNAAIRLKDQSNPILKTWPQLEPQLRVLAYFLLDTAQRSYAKHGSKKLSQNLVRILKTGLKAARTCLASDALDLCTMLFEKMAEHVEHKQDPPPEYKRDKQESEAQEMIKELTADYYLLRATTSWKQDKLDNVSFWFAKVLLLPNRSDMLHLAEKKADLAYEVGKSALQRKQFASAVRWLDHSFQTLRDIDQEMLSSDFCDLCLVVLLDYARALIGVGDASSLDKASNLLVTLDQEHGFKTEVYLLRLDAIYAQRPFKADQFCGALNKVVRGAMLSDGTFKSIMYQIQKLNIYNPDKESATNQTTIANSTPGPHSYLACQTLDLLLSRLLGQPPITQAWIEKTVVTRVWISSLSTHVQDHPSKLGNLFDDIAHTNGTRLGLEATHASQSLIWKAVTALQQAANEDKAAKWCGLANHEIFASSGELNKAKLLRKSMTVALSRDDVTAARTAYHQMSENGKSAAMTQYLMYKIALQENDIELATQSLEGVMESPFKGTEKYLYACALEAQQIGDRRQFIATLHKVLEFYEKNPSSDVRLPVLLRCIAGSIETELNNDNTPLDVGLTELCKVFEAAMRHGSQFEDGDGNDTHLAELRWFACHCYNTALKHCSDMQPELLTRFMMASVALIDLLRKDGGNDDGLLSRLLLCRFLATSALIVLARSEDNIERALQLYLDARRQIAAFHHRYQEVIQNGWSQSDAVSDIEIRKFEMIKFDLEALMRLENWQDLDKVLSMCLEIHHSNRLESAADLILHIHTHISSSSTQPITSNLVSKIPSVMEKIINTCWRNNKDITRLARWIRCLFQMTLTTDSVISLRCLDQASAIASKAATKQIPEAYPPEELEWLASTAFNHAVDHWFTGAEEEAKGQAEGNEQARIWAEKALMLAGSVSGIENGMQGLHKVLQDKWMKLKGLDQIGV